MNDIQTETIDSLLERLQHLRNNKDQIDDEVDQIKQKIGDRIEEEGAVFATNGTSYFRIERANRAVKVRPDEGNEELDVYERYGDSTTIYFDRFVDGKYDRVSKEEFRGAFDQFLKNAEKVI